MIQALSHSPGDVAAAVGPYWLAVVLPLAGFLINGGLALTGRRNVALVSVVGAGVMLGAFGAAVVAFLGLYRAGPDASVTTVLWHWIEAGELNLQIAFRLDQLSAVLLLVVTGVGGLIHLFSVGYMKEDEGYARYFAYLNLFVVFMLILILGASLPVLFIGWEGVGLCSYLLIGFWYDSALNSDAGKKAFLMNRIGDMGVLIAMFLLWYGVGTLDFAELTSRAPSVMTMDGPLAIGVALALFLGCAGKSAQIPLFTWLPDAMAGPTPVSALIHAATMVTAGVYLIARSNVIFTLAPTAQLVVSAIGAGTALVAALIGLRQWDIKKVLAYSTVSQLGYMFLGVGSGVYTAGVFHLVTHAFFKAALFLGSGAVIHALHHAYYAAHIHGEAQDMRHMGGLRKHLPLTWIVMWTATLALAGVPLFSGFFSKDEILAAAFARGASGDGAWFVFYGCALIAAFLTAVYIARMMALTFHGESRVAPAAQSHVHEVPWTMSLPLVVLALLSAVGGVINLPAFIGGHHWLEHWLEPVLAPSLALRQIELPHGTTEHVLIGAAVLVALTGLVLGFRAALANPTAESTGFAKVLERKFYVDEIYDAVIVRPVIWFARNVLWKVVDAFLIDAVAVMGSARFLSLIGRGGSRLQTGQIGLYLLILVAGAVWVLHYVF